MNIIRNISYGALAVAALTGCSDYLTPDNPSAGNSNGEDYVIKNPTSLRATTYDAFSSFVTNVALHDQGADLYINPRSGSDGAYSEYSFNPTDGDIEKYYKNAYKGINYANAMIKYNGEGSKLADEAYFLRAFGYYLLTQQFGAVPYVTYYIQDTNRSYPRTPIEEIYASEIAILEDLYANSSLDATNHEGTASKQAVAALLTQYYLAAGWDLDTEIVDDTKGTYKVNSTANFAKAAEWAEKAINGVQLTQTFAQKWSPFTLSANNPEEIFSFQWERQDGIIRGHSLQNDYIAYWGNCENTGLKGTGSGGTNMPSDKALYLYEKGDNRWDATFMNIFYNANVVDKDGLKRANWGNEGYFAYWNCSSEELAKQLIAYKYWPYYTTEEEAESEIEAIKDRLLMEGDPRITDQLLGIKSPECAILTESDIVFYGYQKWDEKTSSYPSAEKIFWEISVPAKEEGKFDKYAWAKSHKSWSEFYEKPDGNGVCVKKWDDPASGQVTKDACYRDVPLYHVSDMYLYAAEAYLMAGQEGKALEKVNAVRKRAGLQNLSSFADYQPQYSIPVWYEQTPLDLILDERARELYAERTRWFDLKRTKQLVKYNLAFARSITDKSQMCNAKGEVKWLRPIPQNEINYNLALSVEDQNPGY